MRPETGASLAAELDSLLEEVLPHDAVFNGTVSSDFRSNLLEGDRLNYKKFYETASFHGNFYLFSNMDWTMDFHDTEFIFYGNIFIKTLTPSNITLN